MSRNMGSQEIVRCLPRMPCSITKSPLFQRSIV
jgi:hypothetical protein